MTTRDEPDAIVHVVDDDLSQRAAIGRLLEHSGYAVRTYASAGDYLVAEPVKQLACMLLDMEMPGPNGLELQQALRRRGELVPIVFMSAYADVPRTVLAIKGGASDFLVKPLQAQTLLAAIESALAVAEAAPAVPGDKLAPLNERERVVLRGILVGRLNKQLATDLGLSERTIKTCRADLMRKLGAGSLADLVRLGTPLIG